jgi:hypothetical protein
MGSAFSFSSSLAFTIGSTLGIILGLQANDGHKLKFKQFLAFYKLLRRKTRMFIKYPPVVVDSLSQTTAASADKFDHSHSLWSSVLKRHVSSAKLNGCDTNVVNYDAVSGDKQFDQYLKEIAAVKKEDVRAWSADKQLAFYINAYNSLCLNHVVRYTRYTCGDVREISKHVDQREDYAPTNEGRRLTKLTDIPSKIGRKEINSAVYNTTPGLTVYIAPVKSKGTPSVWNMHAGVVAGKAYSLNDIEHGIIRKGWVSQAYLTQLTLKL